MASVAVVAEGCNCRHGLSADEDTAALSAPHQSPTPGSASRRWSPCTAGYSSKIISVAPPPPQPFGSAAAALAGVGTERTDRCTRGGLDPGHAGGSGGTGEMPIGAQQESIAVLRCIPAGAVLFLDGWVDDGRCVSTSGRGEGYI